jgi:hypothetical protein
MEKGAADFEASNESAQDITEEVERIEENESSEADLRSKPLPSWRLQLARDEILLFLLDIGSENASQWDAGSPDLSRMDVLKESECKIHFQ